MMPVASWMIGAIKLTRFIELAAERPPHWGYRNLTTDEVRKQTWLRPHFATEDGKLKACIQSFVLETASQRIIVDTCVGNDKPRQTEAWNGLQTSFLEDLHAAGYPPDTISTVLCTHLHVDHVGWNTRLVDGRWEPTFANAKYLFGRIEWEHWSQEMSNTREGDIAPHVAGGIMEQTLINQDSIQPVIDAGLQEFVEVDHQICAEISLEPTPGHTPGHVSIIIQSEGERAVITGDMMHHPIQCAMPHVASNFDHDVARAHETRTEFLRRYADGPVRIFGTHFGDPTWGHIVTEGEAWRLEVEEA